MNIFELLSFDIVEFATSIEGILIIVGILFLIIGIVLLCMGKGKSKDEKTDSVVSEDKVVEIPAQVAPTQVTPVETPVQVAPVQSMPVEAPAQPVAPIETPKVETPVENLQQPVQNAVSSAQEATPIIVPTVTGGLQESATSPVVEPINFTEEVNHESVMSAPVVENKTETVDVRPSVVNENLNSVGTPAVETLTSAPTSAPVVEPLVEERKVPEVLNETPAVDTPVTVYGGTNPEAVIRKENLEEKPREIYGGANPLENTAPIPTDTVREAYSGGLSYTPVTPAPTPAVVETPAPTVVTPAPAPMPAVDVPTSVSMPTVEPATVTVNEQPVQNSVEPRKEEIEKLEF